MVEFDCGALRNARMVEALGDFILFMSGGMQLGSYVTIKVLIAHQPESYERT
ncbi:hypothetical protein [Iningainema tapete]|uniref:Uncharacterized protein n=1 Tax=Iningainema tapete BLCC-T55 TaxID=2748662 RepID=A0A8J6XC77_9CYAN|nr:hypothetical protein [Iningainema tapete]MBD2772239.1 hypothetical protein [Iningainema tapete BLCC-T55]